MEKRHDHDLIRLVIGVVFGIQQEIRDLLFHDRDRAFEPITLLDQKKTVTVLDVYAEMAVAQRLRKLCRHLNPLIIGEESLKTYASRLAAHSGVVFLLDILDGTRLCQLGLPDWCSAVVCYRPATGEIVLAVVVLPNGTAYFASADGAGRAQRAIGGALEFGRVSGPSSERSATRATVAFYGYNARRFVAMRQRFPHWIDTEVSGDANPNVFVVGGNPALVHMIDGHRTIDAVVEPFGQMPHDIIAGAYICRQAGGFLIDDAGQPLDLEALLVAGLTSKIRYIAAATPELALELQAELASHVSRREMVRETCTAPWEAALQQ